MKYLNKFRAHIVLRLQKSGFKKKELFFLYAQSPNSFNLHLEHHINKYSFNERALNNEYKNCIPLLCSIVLDLFW